MLEPARMSTLPHHVQIPVEPPLPEEDLEFEVEALLDKQVRNHKIEYRVLWQGYPEEAASWETIDLLGCPTLIQEYEESVGGQRL